MNRQKKGRRWVCVVTSIALIASLVGCALYSNGNFEPYSGPNVFTGQGGSKRTYNGIDIWDTGSPPGRFRILGYIFQHDFENGSVMSVLADLDTMKEITKQAKQQGGDAIIFEAQNATFGYGAVITKSRIAVIKYLPAQ